MFRYAFISVFLLAPAAAAAQGTARGGATTATGGAAASTTPAAGAPAAATPAPAPAAAPAPAPGPFTNRVLVQILDGVRQSYNRGERPIVIFDLEGTLFDNRSRILQIIREYGEQELKTVRPQFARLLADATVSQVQYMLPDTLKGIGVSEDAVVNNAAIFWSQRFFTDDYLKYDTVNAGAVRFVRELYSSGARIVYLSGRDAQRQLVGTVKQLRDNGFPIGIQNSELIMRPTAQMQDVVFKQQVTNYLRQFGKVLAAFDSEPANANVLRRGFPEATCVAFSAPRAPNPPPLLPNIIAIASFD